VIYDIISQSKAAGTWRAWGLRFAAPRRTETDCIAGTHASGAAAASFPLPRFSASPPQRRGESAPPIADRIEPDAAGASGASRFILRTPGPRNGLRVAIVNVQVDMSRQLSYPLPLTRQASGHPLLRYSRCDNRREGLERHFMCRSTGRKRLPVIFEKGTEPFLPCRLAVQQWAGGLGQKAVRSRLSRMSLF